jgi:transcriptional regulator of arginine metabolism
MKQRHERHNAISGIITSEKIDNQEELLLKLVKSGFNVTQATLSRDLKALAVYKKPDSAGGYYYSLPEDAAVPPNNDLFLSGYKSIAFSGNTGVVKTLPGYAASIASIIDSRNIDDILGTVAGDDTIIVVLKEGADRNKVESGILRRT